MSIEIDDELTDTLIMAYDLAREIVASSMAGVEFDLDLARNLLNRIDNEHPDIYRQWLDNWPAIRN